MPYGATLAVERTWRDRTWVITRRIQTHLCLRWKANVPVHLYRRPTCWWRLSTGKWIEGKVDCHRLGHSIGQMDKPVEDPKSTWHLCQKEPHLFTIGTESVLDASCTKITHEISLIQPWPPKSLNALLPSQFILQCEQNNWSMWCSNSKGNRC